MGGGFIGLEIAAALRQREVDVTVVAPGTVPMARPARRGPRPGPAVPARGERHPLRRRAARRPGTARRSSSRTGSASRPTSSSSGSASSRAPRSPRRPASQVDDGVLVDATFETPVRGVFAVGDIARFPDPLTGRSIRVEHWAQAQRSGALAAVNLLGGQQAITEPPFYWTQQFGKSFRLSGHAESLEHGDADGSAADQQLLVTFREEGRVVAAAGLGRDHDLLVVEDVELRQPAL